MAATYTSMIAGKVAAGYLADVFGRRVIWVLTGLATAATLPLIMYFATSANVAALLLVFGLLYGAPYALLAAYMSESYPTSVRATGMAAAYAVGRTGSTISPLMIGWAATHYSIGLGIAFLGVSYAICGIIPGLFIPERMYDPRSASVPVENAAG
jgi:AAHS family cis,cis-muconate transporter-like MFS transporter